MADLFNQHDISIEEKFADESLLCYVDKDEFIQSVTNLLRNSLQAVAAARKTGGRVTISTVGGNDGQIRVNIEDNGEGIAAENHGKLFEKQFTTKEKEDGTGLGLSISRRFIRAVGGDICLLESVPQQKTVFEIVLPLAEEDIIEEAVA
jgi:signal transduction histidine kinase